MLDRLDRFDWSGAQGTREQWRQVAGQDGLLDGIQGGIELMAYLEAHAPAPIASTSRCRLFKPAPTPHVSRSCPRPRLDSIEHAPGAGNRSDLAAAGVELILGLDRQEA